MSMPLSKLIDNLSEGIHNNTCVDCKSCLDYIKIKNEKLNALKTKNALIVSNIMKKILIKNESKGSLVRTNFVIRILINSSCY